MLSATDLSYEAGPEIHQWQRLFLFGGDLMLGISLEPQGQPFVNKWMFGETTIFYIKIWNHPIETSIYKWLFGVLVLGVMFLVQE